MIDKGILKSTIIPVIKRVLDVSLLNQRIIANNIANVNTPGYRAREVDEEKAFNYIFESKRKDLIESSEEELASLIQEQPTNKSNGMNTVDIEKEMARLAENQILFQSMAKILQNKFKGIRMSITGKTS